MEIRNLKQKVRTTLERYPHTRNCDDQLVIYLCKDYFPHYLPHLDFILGFLKEVKTSAVERFRRQIQNDDKEFIPTVEEVAIKRGWEEEKWRDRLGYYVEDKGQMVINI